MMQHQGTPELKVIHFPSITPKSVIGLVEILPIPYQQMKISYHYERLIRHHYDCKIILFQERAQLLPSEAKLDPPVQQKLYNLEGRSCLSSGLRAIIELFHQGNLQKHCILFLMLYRCTKENLINEFTQELEEEYLKATYGTNIELHILSIGGQLLQIQDLIRQKFRARNEDIVREIGLSSNFSRRIPGDFAHIEKLMSQCYPSLNGDGKAMVPGKSSPLVKNINQEYYITFDLPELALKNLETSVKSVAVEPITINSLLSITETYYNYLRLCQRRSQNHIHYKVIHAIEKLKDLSQAAVYKNKTEVRQFQKALQRLMRIDLKTFQSSFEAAAKYETLKKTSITDLHTLAIYGQTYIDFQQHCQELYETIQNSFIDFQNSEQEPSCFSFSNQKDVLADLDYLQLLKGVQNQYQCLLQFPLIGQGLFIERINDVNCLWTATSQQIPSYLQNFDSCQIFQGGNSAFLIKNALGQEQVNAVLPMYTSLDADLKPFIRSKFFDSLMTLLVMQTGDICHPEAHASLLARYLIAVIEKPESEWRRGQLDLIHHTYMLKYADYQPFNRIVADLLSNQPSNAFFDPLQALYVIEPLKIVLLLFILRRNDIKEFNRIIENTFKMLMLTCVKPCSTSEAISNFEQKLLNRNNLAEQIASYIEKKPIDRFYDWQKEIHEQCTYTQLKNNWFCKFTINEENITNGNFPLECLEKVYKFFQAGKSLKFSILEVLYRHSNHQSTQSKLSKPFLPDERSRSITLENLFNLHFNLYDFIGEVMGSLLWKTYIQCPSIRQTPEFNFLQFEKTCQQMQIDIGKYQLIPGYPEGTYPEGVQNTCINPDCYFYMFCFQQPIHSCWCEFYNDQLKDREKPKVEVFCVRTIMPKTLQLSGLTIYGMVHLNLNQDSYLRQGQQGNNIVSLNEPITIKWKDNLIVLKKEQKGSGSELGANLYSIRLYLPGLQSEVESTLRQIRKIFRRQQIRIQQFQIATSMLI